MLSFIPNSLTLGNLFCGVLGIIYAFNSELEISALLIGIAAILDFFDGFVARLLKVSGELGKQLDSLADAVTFGVLPGIIMFQMLSISFGDYFTLITERPTNHLAWEFVGLLIPIFSVLRLAKFNIDENQKTGFIGLPTPASAIFIASLPIIQYKLGANFYNPITGKLLGATANLKYWGPLEFYTFGTLQDTYFLSIVSICISILLVAPIPLLSFKFSDFTWKNNKARFIYLILAFVSILFVLIPYIDFEIIWKLRLPFFDFLVIPWLIILYVLVSIGNNIAQKKLLVS